MLTDYEQSQYEKQLRQLASPYYHSEAKCGKSLILTFIQKTQYKKTFKIRNLRCEIHNVDCSMSGFEWNHYLDF